MTVRILLYWCYASLVFYSRGYFLFCNIFVKFFIWFLSLVSVWFLSSPYEKICLFWRLTRVKCLVWFEDYLVKMHVQFLSLACEKLYLVWRLTYVKSHVCCKSFIGITYGKPNSLFSGNSQ